MRHPRERGRSGAAAPGVPAPAGRVPRLARAAWVCAPQGLGRPHGAKVRGGRGAGEIPSFVLNLESMNYYHPFSCQ